MIRLFIALIKSIYRVRRYINRYNIVDMNQTFEHEVKRPFNILFLMK